MSSLHLISQSFEPITLKEMDAVKLMDRVDTKYTFHIAQLPGILEKLMPFYRLLEVEGVRRCQYENQYYDTSDFLFYRQHHNGKKNRYKIRFRNYTDSDLRFFEIKFSSNKGRTIKERIRVDSIPEKIEGKAEKFLLKKTPYTSSCLLPLLRICYTRMTFVGRSGSERVTIDTDLEFTHSNRNTSFPSLVIAESKQDKCCRSPFSELMKSMRVQSGSISKYCFGMIHLYPHLKRNIFKPRLKAIYKICHEEV